MNIEDALKMYSLVTWLEVSIVRKNIYSKHLLSEVNFVRHTVIHNKNASQPWYYAETWPCAVFDYIWSCCLICFAHITVWLSITRCQARTPPEPGLSFATSLSHSPSLPLGFAFLPLKLTRHRAAQLPVECVWRCCRELKLELKLEISNTHRVPITQLPRYAGASLPPLPATASASASAVPDAIVQLW